MDKTIIFMNGFMIPKILAKSSFVWNDSLWKGYRRIYLSSKTPTSDWVVENELSRLTRLINRYPGAIVAGHSLGAWWGANLACRPECKISKLVFWTPLADTNEYPIFNVSNKYHPINLIPNSHNRGPHETLVFIGKDDFIVPPKNHGHILCDHFDGMPYHLDGGHFFQNNHQQGLNYMKTWIELP